MTHGGIMKQKTLIGIGAAAAVAMALATAYFASPFFAATALVEAMRKGDQKKIEALVDFPAVKDSLRTQMTEVLTDSMANDPEMRDNPFAGMAVAMVPAMVGGAVDMMVSPKGLSALAEGQSAPMAAETRAPSPAAENDRPKHQFAYDSLDRFRSSAVSQADPTQRVSFIFERRNVFSWKLVKVELPSASLTHSPQQP